MYGTVLDGTAYFEARTVGKYWKASTDPNRLKALQDAADLINTFNYVGYKPDDQEDAFPRKGQEAVPQEIVWAAYLVANDILGNTSEESVLREAGLWRQKFEQVEVEYARDRVPIHYQYGIKSPRAYRYLSRYFRSTTTIRLDRVT